MYLDPFNVDTVKERNIKKQIGLPRVISMANLFINPFSENKFHVTVSSMDYQVPGLKKGFVENLKYLFRGNSMYQFYRDKFLSMKLVP